jgi:hypothetical protein
MMKNELHALAALVGLLLGCGPSCPEVKAALDATAAITGDVTRVNELVGKRKAAVAEAERGGGTFQMQRLKFSVTAFELAIATQARIIKASPRFEDAPSYRENAEAINGFRCYLDKLLARDGHLVSDGVGETLRAYKAELERLLDRDGTVSPAELRAYYEEGIAVGAAPEGEEDDPQTDAKQPDDEQPGAED